MIRKMFVSFLLATVVLMMSVSMASAQMTFFVVDRQTGQPITFASYELMVHSPYGLMWAGSCSMSCVDSSGTVTITEVWDYNRQGYVHMNQPAQYSLRVMSPGYLDRLVGNGADILVEYPGTMMQLGQIPLDPNPLQFTMLDPIYGAIGLAGGLTSRTLMLTNGSSVDMKVKVTTIAQTPARTRQYTGIAAVQTVTVPANGSLTFESARIKVSAGLPMGSSFCAQLWVSNPKDQFIAYGQLYYCTKKQ